MNERQIDPNMRFAQIFIDETHWLCLTALAKEKGVSPDFLLGVILEGCFVKLGKIEVDTPKESPLKVEVTLEPVREDKGFLDALTKDRDSLVRDRELAESVTPEDKAMIGWGNM